MPVDPSLVADFTGLFERGGPALMAIALLSVIMVALILWKIGHLLVGGAWSGGRHTARAVDLWARGQTEAASAQVAGRRSWRARLACAAMEARRDPQLTREDAELEVARIGRHFLAEARSGVRGLELIATIAPLLGLLGTVLGMIAAFRALEATGARADPAVLAGGIWEALLTTAAGMAVAIPASVAVVWVDAVADRLRREMEDAATRILTRDPARAQRLRAAE
ncbi:MAG: MotA/TolQ/ExbB proton channel family protein [Gemmobacter sp.]